MRVRLGATVIHLVSRAQIRPEAPARREAPRRTREQPPPKAHRSERSPKPAELSAAMQALHRRDHLVLIRVRLVTPHAPDGPTPRPPALAAMRQLRANWSHRELSRAALP